VSNSTANDIREQQLGLFDRTDQNALPEWRVRVSARARNLRIQVFPTGGVEIVAPKRIRPKEIEAFVIEHSDWIRKTQSQFEQLRPPEPPLPDEIQLKAIRKKQRIHYVVSDKACWRLKHGLLTISAPELIPEHCWPLLRDWIKKQGREHLIKETHKLARTTGLQPSAVHIRLQRTRWGSFSSTGTITLNAAALLRPAEEMRYVIIHELCHLHHMNHSKRFWSLVGSFVPEYRPLEKSLNVAWQTSPAWLIA